MDCLRCPFRADLRSVYNSASQPPVHLCLLLPEMGANVEDCGYPYGSKGAEKFEALREDVIRALQATAERLSAAEYDTREM